MRIGVVFTGGTIGSRLDDSGYIGTGQETSYLLLEQYKEKCSLYKRDEIVFVKRNPYTILSENLSGQELEKLISCIRELLSKEQLDGIVITHGTDSLQYTSAVLGYVFSTADIPIVIVSANYVLEDGRSNGLINFNYAVEFIKGGYGKGVFVSYCNHEEVPQIHIATRLNMPVYYSDEVRSIENCLYGYFRSPTEFCYEENPEGNSQFNSGALFPSENQICLKNCPEEILIIHPYVGMKYPELSPATKVIIHGSFHSGTIAITGALRQFSENARKLGIPFYLVGLSAAVNHYETVQSYDRLSIVPLYDRSLISQYCKAWLIVSNGLPVRENMECIMAGEQAVNRNQARNYNGF